MHDGNILSLHSPIKKKIKPCVCVIVVQHSNVPTTTITAIWIFFKKIYSIIKNNKWPVSCCLRQGVSSGFWKMTSGFSPLNNHQNTHLPPPPPQKSTVSVHIFLTLWRKTIFKNMALQIGKMPEGSYYSTTSSGSTKRRCFLFVFIFPKAGVSLIWIYSMSKIVA